MADHHLTAVLPCNNLAASEAFYCRLGFTCRGRYGGYLILVDGQGAELHLTAAAEGWLVPGRNPFGLYLDTQKVDELAARMEGRLLHRPENKPWRMYEFAISDPDETPVRVGWPVNER